MSTRQFRLNTHLTLPLELHAAPGARHRRATPGEIVEIDAERCRLHDRFLRGRIRAGDLTEIEPAAAAPVAAPQPAPSVPTTPVKE